MDPDIIYQFRKLQILMNIVTGYMKEIQQVISRVIDMHEMKTESEKLWKEIEKQGESSGSQDPKFPDFSKDLDKNF